MNRLTMRNSDGTVLQPTSTTVEAVFYRLAEYEDTGLSPEDVREISKRFRELNESGGVDLLQGLLDAYEQGRLVVLPCKVGDTVYQIGGVRLYQSAVESITIAERIYFDASDIYFDESAIGTSVFLSREEAEAALKAKEV